MPVFLGDGHHQPQVGLDEGLLSSFTLEGDTAQLPLFGRCQALGRRRQLSIGLPPGLDGLGQPDLVVLGQQRILADVGQIKSDEVFVVPLEALLCQLHQVLWFPLPAEGRPTPRRELGTPALATFGIGAFGRNDCCFRSLPDVSSPRCGFRGRTAVRESFLGHGLAQCDQAGRAPAATTADSR